MTIGQRFANTLESRWVTPSYAGWLLGSLAIFFFVAATNTLAGWLYVISGISFALLIVAAIGPARSLSRIEVTRQPLHPISAGDRLVVELAIANPTSSAKSLLQIQDLLPTALGKPVTSVLETLPADDVHIWNYSLVAERRGVFRWQTVKLRTAAPLGLFWCHRDRIVPATAIVYPIVLPLTRCPLIDTTGRAPTQFHSAGYQAEAATAGLTRSLRPYRWGDPTRLVHWRSSARYGELRVRELEVFIEGQRLLICLDSASPWSSDDFEQAVITAASLYFYARRHNQNVQLWTAGTGPIQNHQNVLEVLARVSSNEIPLAGKPPEQPMIWLSQNPASLNLLSSGSRWLLWSTQQPLFPQGSSLNSCGAGLVIQPDQPLQLQLQSAS